MARAKTLKNTAEIGFEKKIWQAAVKLQGHVDPSEYKNVVLGLIFLKYISDKFEERYIELVEEGEGFEEDKDEYTAENIFWVPANARWKVIANASTTSQIGMVIDDAMRAIEMENPKLKGVLPKNFARQELDQRKLGAVVDLFTNVSMAEKGDTRDILGRTYEYCLTMFAENEGKNAGQFYTPSCVVRTLVEVIQPFHGRVYDPCCGSGGMFVQSANFVRNHAGRIENISVYGQESNPTTWKMAVMNLAIRGIDANLGGYAADTFFDDRHKNERFDFILANPPFNKKDWGGERLTEDPRWDFGVPPTSNANFAWIQHMIHHLSPKGKIALVLANGALSSQESGQGDIRQKIIEADLIEGIVALPTQLFYSTQIPVCLWFLNNKKNQPGKTLFIDARNLGTMVSRKLREFTDDDIMKIASTFIAFEEGGLETQRGFSAIATVEEIAKQDYSLIPGRYVGTEEQEEDDEPFEQKFLRLSEELNVLFEKSNLLQQKIIDNIASLKIGI